MHTGPLRLGVRFSTQRYCHQRRHTMLLTSGSVLRRVSVAVAFILISVSAQAAGLQPFDAKAFQAAQASGKPVLVEIHADWCPTCKAQVPILDKLASDP